MSSDIKPRVLALGTATTLKRLCAYDVDHNFDLTGLSNKNELIELAQRDHFDVILVDVLYDEASGICRQLTEMNCAPVALLVREAEVNWQDLCSWSVDGFVSDDSTKIEMVARLMALARRSRRLQVTRT
jgi:DNA-binding response OmpR family regulator